MKPKSVDSSLQRRISNVNWNQVYYFSLVAALGSIKQASDALDLRSSTLSEHISQLESSLGTQLFFRKGPKLSLTEPGQKLFRHAKQMFENGQKILDVSAPVQLEAYPVAVGLVPGPHLFSAHRTLCDYAEAFGPLDLRIAQSSFEALEDGLADRLDFGFADRPSKRRDLISHCLSSSQIRFFVAAKWRDHSLREVLKKIPLLVCQSVASTDAFIEKALDEAGLHPCSVTRAEYPSVLMDLCRRGLGVGAFSDDSLELGPKESLRTLQNPREAPRIATKTFALWSRESENTLAISQLRQLLKL